LTIFGKASGQAGSEPGRKRDRRRRRQVALERDQVEIASKRRSGTSARARSAQPTSRTTSARTRSPREQARGEAEGAPTDQRRRASAAAYSASDCSVSCSGSCSTRTSCTTLQRRARSASAAPSPYLSSDRLPRSRTRCGSPDRECRDAALGDADRRGPGVHQRSHPSACDRASAATAGLPRPRCRAASRSGLRYIPPPSPPPHPGLHNSCPDGFPPADAALHR